jgi:hypothetical protein
MMFATKNLKARCDVARQPLWRYVKGRHRICDHTWSFATNLKKLLSFASISSETTHVVTATVAAFDVSPQGLSRNITTRLQVFSEVACLQILCRQIEVKYMALSYNILLLPYIATNKNKNKNKIFLLPLYIQCYILR